MILLWDWGEPFLNPSIYEMIAHAKRHSIKIVSSTNGLIFADGDHAEQLVRSGIDTIWRGVPYRRLRRQFRRAYEEIPLCRECTYAFKGGALLSEHIAEAHFFG